MRFENHRSRSCLSHETEKHRVPSRHLARQVVPVAARAEGIVEGKRETMLATAKRMLKSGMLALKNVARFLGLPLAQVMEQQVWADDAATFTSVPSLAEGVKGYKIKLSADGKTIKVVSKGCVIVVR